MMIDKDAMAILQSASSISHNHTKNTIYIYQELDISTRHSHALPQAPQASQGGDVITSYVDTDIDQRYTLYIHHQMWKTTS